jgi:amino acid transporter
MVSGGAYGLEELVAAGYGVAVVALVVTPFIWSLPTALMVGELAGALPEEGGYYAWVRRALGPFWGFQEAWLSLVASIFDMAIYPTLFTLYLGRLVPWAGEGSGAVVVGALLIAVCAAWNVRGAASVGGGAVLLTLALLAPFAIFAVMCVFCTSTHAPPALPHRAPGILSGVLIAMWNYMGWDNSSTIAGEVERPERTYPLAMLIAVALVLVTYVVPVVAAAFAGLDPSQWTTGGWVNAAREVGGPGLALAVVLGGMVCGIGMFNALLLSYSRLPAVLAEDGFLPSFFAQRHPRSGAPWVSIVVCSFAYAACLGIGFVRLVELDILLYGASLVLEFVALAVLRLREPDLLRRFKVPGGPLGAILLGVGPVTLLLLALWHSKDETLGPISALAFGCLCAAAGPLLYLFRSKTRQSTARGRAGRQV